MSRRRHSSRRRPADRRTDDRRRGPSIGARRLASEVEKVLHYALSEIDDDRINDVLVLRVLPAPNESRLRVEVQSLSGRPDAEVLGALAMVKGNLAAAITDATSYRRKHPDFYFAIGEPDEVPPDEVPPDEAPPDEGPPDEAWGGSDEIDD